MLSGILVFAYVLCTFIYCASYVRYEIKAKNYLSAAGTCALLLCAAVIISAII